MSEKPGSPHWAASSEGRVLRVVGALIAGIDLAIVWSDLRAGQAVPWTAWARPLWMAALVLGADPRFARRWPTRQPVTWMGLAVFGMLYLVVRTATHGS